MILGETDKMDEKVRPSSERFYGTLGVHAYSYLEGADILRVHEVKEHKDMLNILFAVRSGSDGRER